MPKVTASRPSERRRPRIVAVSNQKGGEGKTTTAVNLAACAAAESRQILLVDLDSQCNATVALGLDRDLAPSSYECLCGDTSVAAAARPAGLDNLWIVDSSFFPSSAALNPALTIAANALRVADTILATRDPGVQRLSAGKD